MLVVGPILVNATRRFRHGYLPHCTGQRIDSNAAKPSRKKRPRLWFCRRATDIGHPGRWRCYRTLRWQRVATWVLRSTRWRGLLTGWQRKRPVNYDTCVTGMGHLQSLFDDRIGAVQFGFLRGHDSSSRRRHQTDKSQKTFGIACCIPDIGTSSLTGSKGATISMSAAPAPDQEMSLNLLKPISALD